MKKKLVLTAAAIALVGTLAVGGTLAWFTDVETATNVVTMGKVDIAVSENGGEDGIANEGGIKYTDKMPGDKLDKIVTIDNLEQAAWVRAKIEVTGLEKIETESNEHIKFFKMVGEDPVEITVNWENGTGLGVVETWGMDAGEEDYVLFDYIQIPEKWGNEFVNAEFSIELTVEAVQQANLPNKDTAFEDFANIVPDLKANDGKGEFIPESSAPAEVE